MKILVISDVACKALWDYFDKSRLEGIDLILSSGDLPANYLSFLVTFAPCPVLYVRGNHDDSYAEKPPEGCICIEDKIYVHEGVRILGLGGSMRYNDGINQFTEKDMAKRVRRMRWKIKRKKGFDILLTHSPALGINDEYDLPHWGFKAFLDMLDKYSPKYMVHGHVHMNYGASIPRETQYHDTTVINAYERYILEI